MKSLAPGPEQRCHIETCPGRVASTEGHTRLQAAHAPSASQRPQLPACSPRPQHGHGGGQGSHVPERAQGPKGPGPPPHKATAESPQGDRAGVGHITWSRGPTPPPGGMGAHTGAHTGARRQGNTLAPTCQNSSPPHGTTGMKTHGPGPTVSPSTRHAQTCLLEVRGHWGGGPDAETVSLAHGRIPWGSRKCRSGSSELRSRPGLSQRAPCPPPPWAACWTPGASCPAPHPPRRLPGERNPGLKEARTRPAPRPLCRVLSGTHSGKPHPARGAPRACMSGDLSLRQTCPCGSAAD